MKIGCIVLAAGRSARFGENKLLADLNGTPVLARTLRAVPRESFAKCVCVCASAEVERLARDCGFPVKHYPGGALSDSIRTGLEGLPATDGILFVNGDQPLLRRESMLRLMETFAAHPRAVCRLTFGGVPGSPVLFPADLRSALGALRGEAGGMAAAKRCGAEAICAEADFEAELWDTDDPEALRRAKEFLDANPRYEGE